MTGKKVIISILNGGFLDKYHDDENINEFLKNIEEESRILHEYFYKIDKIIDDEKVLIIKVKILVEFCKIMKISY